MLIRHLWQLKTVAFLHWCQICAVLLHLLLGNIDSFVMPNVIMANGIVESAIMSSGRMSSDRFLCGIMLLVLLS